MSFWSDMRELRELREEVFILRNSEALDSFRAEVAEAEVARLTVAIEMLTGALNVADLTISRHDDGPAMNARSVIRHALKHAGHTP